MQNILSASPLVILTLLLSLVCQPIAQSKEHPYETLGREVFESLKNQDFNKFFSQSVFSLKEYEFKEFLFTIRNQNIRDHLVEMHKIPFPDDANTTQKKWNLVFAHNWRNEWRHLARNTPLMIKSESFLPLLDSANDYGFQWETVSLLSVEVLLPMNWQNGRFEIRRDLDLSAFDSDSRSLFVERNMTYRLRPDKTTYSKSFMVGEKNEDSESIFKKGILGNRSGQGDITIRFEKESPSELFYFCPDQKGAGGVVRILDSANSDKPNQRQNLLLTITYGKPTRFFQILLKEVMMVGNRAVFFDRPQWLDQVDKPSHIQIWKKNDQ